MVININPNRVNVRSGSTSARQRQSSGESAEAYKSPARSEVNFIPAPESLRTLIAGAVVALRRGVYWDRGTILNLLV